MRRSYDFTVNSDAPGELFVSTEWGALAALMLLGSAVILLVIGLIAVCRADRKDIPAVLKALAGWFPWGQRNRGR